MRRLRSLALPASLAMALALSATGSHAQTARSARSLFEQHGCSQCHAFVARGTGPSVREMMKRFKGAPDSALAAISAAKDHGADSQFKATSRGDLQTMADWLAAMSTPAGASTDKAARAAETPKSAAAAAKSAQNDAAQRREAEAKAKQEAAAQARRDADERAKLEADAKTRKGTETQSAQKRDADERSRREADLKTRQEVESQARRDTDERSRREAETKARLEAESQAQAKREAEAKAKRDAETKARLEAENQARREAEERARRDAEAQALAKRDGEAKPKKERGQGKAPEKFRDEPCPPISPTAAPIGTVDEERAKAIIDRVGCPQCHAYVQKKTGPPFKKVYEKVKGNPECVIHKLKTNQEHKEEGVTQDIMGPEFKILGDYLATRAK